MTTIKLVKRDGHIFEVEAKGHTGYAEQGQDIVCAAVSALVQGALLGLIEVARADVKKTIKEGYLRFIVRDTDGAARQSADVILETMRLAVKDIKAAYPSHIKMEETENVY